MTDDEVNMSYEPTDRLTRLAVQITAGLETEENSDVRAIIMLDDGKMGGIMMHGYEDGTEAAADLFVHMRAMFRAQGKELELVAIPDSPEGVEDA